MSEEKKQEKHESVQDQLARVQLENALLEQANLKAEAEAKQLEKQERQYHIKSLKSSIADRELDDKQTELNRAQQGRAIAQQDSTDKYNWSVCTHRKGGMAHARDIRCLTRGGNDAGQYAVIKHQMINGDIWVRCQRCGKTWQPPVESNFYFLNGKQVAPVDGTFDVEAFKKAKGEYEVARDFPTRNSMSGSVQCRFYYVNDRGEEVDGAKKYRENVGNSNLR